MIVCSWGARKTLFRAIGGRDAQSGEFPYVVFIEQRLHPIPPSTGPTRYEHVCTASALSATVTLTAAHCCFPLREQVHLKDRHNGSVIHLDLSMVIRYGSDTGRSIDDDRFSDVLSCLLPPSARPAIHMVMSEDVALLSTQPMPLTAYARLSAVDQRTLYGQRVLVLGFGLTNSSDGEVKSSLELKKPLQVVDVMWSRCEEQARPMLYPLVCGMETCGHHVAFCQGDSGGPALHASKIVGVSARAPIKGNCQVKTDATRSSYVIYIMPLSSHMDWIASTIAEAPKFL